RRACAGRTRDPVEKWLPDLSRLLSVQSLGDHVDDERVVGVDVRLLTPMVVEEMLAVEAHELADQAPVGVVGRRFDGDADGTEELGQLVHAERHLADHAEAAASTALQRPEQIGVRACIRDANLAVRRDDFGLEQTSRGAAIMLREAAEASALNQASEAHRRASAALYVFATLGGDCLIRLHADRSRAERHRRLWLHSMLAALRNERGIDRDVVHVAGAESERGGRRGGPPVTGPRRL